MVDFGPELPSGKRSYFEVRRFAVISLPITPNLFILHKYELLSRARLLAQYGRSSNYELRTTNYKSTLNAPVLGRMIMTRELLASAYDARLGNIILLLRVSDSSTYYTTQQRIENLSRRAVNMDQQERIEAASNFLLQAPPGEINDVLNGA